MPWLVFWGAVVVIVLAAVAWTWTHPSVSRWLYANSRTLLVARLLQVLSVLMLGYDLALPILQHPDFQLVLPDHWRWAWPLILFVIGQIFARLRQFTDEPLEQRKAQGRAKLVQLVPGVKQ